LIYKQVQLDEPLLASGSARKRLSLQISEGRREDEVNGHENGGGSIVRKIVWQKDHCETIEENSYCCSNKETDCELS